MNGFGSPSTGRSGASERSTCSTWWRSSPPLLGQRHGSAVATSTVAAHTAQRRPIVFSTPARSARRDACVEVVDHLVPHVDVAPQAAPERLRAAGLEQLERRALLLHPRVVAE